MGDGPISSGSPISCTSSNVPGPQVETKLPPGLKKFK